MVEPSEKTIQAEAERFRAALPKLRGDLDGKWVVFKDGVVRGVYGEQEEAYVAGVREFGSRGGFLVARVEEQIAVPLSASVFFTRFALP